MDLVSRRLLIHGTESEALSPITTPETSLFRTSLHSSDPSFPIIAIAIIGILATAFLLVSYYIFVIKCCLNWHRIDLLRRLSLSRNRATHEELLMAYNSPGIETRGLEESVIRSIPVFQFKKETNRAPGIGEKTFSECAVCLNEFQEDEKLRMIPNCCHVFHIDCIDVWLQNNDNCPLCRTSVSTASRFRLDQIVAPSSSPIDPSPYAGSLAGADDDDYVVIELTNDNNIPSSSSEPLSGVRSVSTPSPWRNVVKLENDRVSGKKGGGGRRKLQKGTSMGDECIDISREKDEQFSIQPIRRSFSMDSSADRKMFMAIQEALQQQRQVLSNEVVSPIEGCSSRVRRSFFSFGHGRGSSRSAVLPVYLEP